MNRARILICLPLLATACELPQFAQFPPLSADAPRQRIERDRFSILVPQQWRPFAETADRSLHYVEDAPANGQIRAYRSVVVREHEPVAADSPEAALAAAQAALQAAHTKDNLKVLATGRATIAGRECAMLRGTITPSSFEVVLESLSFLVPGEGSALLVEFTVPSGQFDAAEPGFTAMAKSLQTTMPPPRFGGDLLWLDGDRIGMLAPDGWQRVDDPASAIAAFTLADGDALCELSTATSANGYDLARLAQGYVHDQAPQWADLRIVAVERGTRGGRAFVRFRGAYRDGLGTVFVDDSFFVAGTRLDRVLCRVPAAERDRALPTVDRIVGSLRWR